MSDAPLAALDLGGAIPAPGHVAVAAGLVMEAAMVLVLVLAVAVAVIVCAASRSLISMLSVGASSVDRLGRLSLAVRPPGASYKDEGDEGDEDVAGDPVARVLVVCRVFLLGIGDKLV